ncbi:Ig-like domain-containing protein [Paenibacillus spongiae]|uniref:Ig-like domain-containing protein n=1 Tax=Paenibacillus spongiae TaxID=2909671 RepID=A0ABY5SGD2_9BACL|nr:Ig-like domain-containing protein [Paenibacillus spongiae]UVI32714.1 Ig-like domain-containing protein [Paenibacillus spongiae]
MEFIVRKRWLRVVMSLIIVVTAGMQFSTERASALSVPRITVDFPAGGTIISDDFFPRVSVYSLDPVSSVYVLIGDKRFDLPKISTVCSTTCQYGQVLDLSDMPRGQLNVGFHADNGIDGELAVTYTLNNPPNIRLTSPMPFAAVTPNAALSASCEDDVIGGCREMKAKIGSAVLATGVDRLDQALDLTAYDGKRVDLRLEAVDHLAQATVNSHPVYVESNPKLEPVEQEKGLLLDADESRIVYWDAYYHRIVVKDRNTGVENVLPLLVAQQWNLSVRLTPTGVIGTAWDAAGSPYLVIKDGYIGNGRDPMGKFRAFEWRPEGLTDLPLTGLLVNGTFAAYKQTDDKGMDTNRLMIRDLVTNEEREVDETTDPSYTLTGQGELLYVKSGKIYRYSYASGQSEQISQADNALYTSPVADGDTVLYTKNGRDVIVLKDGQEAVLEGTDRSVGYLTSGGWIAFVRNNESGARQYWVRSPEGAEAVAATVKTGSSRLDALAPDGSVTFTDNGTLFISRIGQEGRMEQERLTMDAAKSFYRDGWNVFLGAAWYTAGGKPVEPEPVLKTLRMNVPDKMQLKAGESIALKVEGLYSDERTQDVTLDSKYESADASIVSVSPLGELAAIAPGETVITVSFGSLTSTVSVVVPEPEIPGPSDPTADLDGDGIVGPNDLIEFMRAFGTTKHTSMHYDVRVDFDLNGVIDMKDAAVFYLLYRERR